MKKNIFGFFQRLIPLEHICKVSLENVRWNVFNWGAFLTWSQFPSHSNGWSFLVARDFSWDPMARLKPFLRWNQRKALNFTKNLICCYGTFNHCSKQYLHFEKQLKFFSGAFQKGRLQTTIYSIILLITMLISLCPN